MELKLINCTIIKGKFVSSNRTFMELKFHLTDEWYQKIAVLIAPLWN